MRHQRTIRKWSAVTMDHLIIDETQRDDVATLVKEYAELLPLTEEIQFFWDGKIGREEMVRCA